MTIPAGILKDQELLEKRIAEQLYHQIRLKVFAQAAYAFQIACQRCDISPLLVQPLATKYAEYMKGQDPSLDLPSFVESCLGITVITPKEAKDALDRKNTKR